jgi:pimeloyl-ACP methyl ester carboxylesterase
MSVVADILIALVALPAIAAAGLALVTRASVQRAERLAPADGQFCDVPGARIHYTDRGRGPVIVLIHGLGGQLRNFAPPLVEYLARTHRVVALDRPGSGYSTVTGPYPDLNGQAAMVASLIEQLELGPVVLVGHSLGGALSLALVEARPDLVTSLALIAPLTQQRREAPSAFRILTIRSPFLRKLVGWLVVGPAGRMAGSARRSPVFAPDPIPEDFESLGGGALLYRPGTFDAASRDMQAVPGALAAIEAGYSAIDRPVSVLFGQGDRILEPALHGAAFVTQVPGARLTLVEGGHMLPFTHPVATAEWIEGVLTQAKMRP